MHFGLCWYNNRFRLAAYVTLLMVVTVLATLPASLAFHEGRWVMVRPTTAADVLRIWQTGAHNTHLALLIILLFVAADLGALGLGDDSARRSPDYLLTRPRSRAYFIWTGWSSGVTELLALLVCAVATCVAVLFYLTHALLPGPLLRSSLVICAVAVVMHGVAFWVAVASGSARNGYQMAALVLVLFAGARFALEYGYTFAHPYLSSLFDWVLSGEGSAPLTAVAAMIFASLSFAWFAQLSFARRDL